ncbi:ROK family transcriptional regulator [Brachybacterium sp.]|uniref:ROK family transcriptional regulator n=1 Tax=Brachybacterium sp. TaxID=1891286 RepID=UPI002ECFB3AE
MQREELTDAAAVSTGLVGESTRAVYRDLLRFGPRSRSELSGRLGLSAPTVTRVTRDLLERDLLHPLDAVARTKGRPQEPLDIEENRGPRFIGIKVTSEEVHAVVTTVRGNVLEELVLALDSTAPESLLETLLVAAEAMIAAHPYVAGIGVGLGGLVAERRTVVSSHLLDWAEPVELAAALEDRVHLPVVVENDLVAMVSGLHWFGIGRTYDSFAVLTVGAGVGLATVIDGRVVRGRHHMAGLTGRLPVDRTADGDPIPIRELASTAAVLRRAREQGVLTDGDGIEELRALITAEDSGALAIAAQTARAVAIAAVGLVAVVDPEAIVLGGENVDLLRAAGSVFEDTLREGIGGGQRDLVVRTLSGDFDEWARGVAVIAIQEFAGAVP